MNEFEKYLKEKLDDLSESVDCFDKIAKKAYPNKNSKLEDNYFTVTELENVTGKKTFKFTHVLALCAVFALILFLTVPNGLHNYIDQNAKIQLTSTERFDILKSELDYELSEYEYDYSDYTLDEYNYFSMFINPLYVYYFPEESSENIYVRVYTKLCYDPPAIVDKNKIKTNQIYLVEYQNEYSDENIISIVDSKAKFSLDDMPDLPEYPETENGNALFDETILSNFDANESGFLLYKYYPSYAVSYNYKSVYKLNGNIYNLSTDVLYLCINCGISYNYELKSCYYDQYKNICEFDNELLNDCWNEIAYKEGQVEQNGNINPFFKSFDDEINISNDNYKNVLKNSKMTEYLFEVTDSEYTKLDNIFIPQFEKKNNFTFYAMSDTERLYYGYNDIYNFIPNTKIRFVYYNTNSKVTQFANNIANVIENDYQIIYESDDIRYEESQDTDR